MAVVADLGPRTRPVSSCTVRAVPSRRARVATGPRRRHGSAAVTSRTVFHGTAAVVDAVAGGVVIRGAHGAVGAAGDEERPGDVVGTGVRGGAAAGIDREICAAAGIVPGDIPAGAAALHASHRLLLGLRRRQHRRWAIVDRYWINN